VRSVDHSTGTGWCVEPATVLPADPARAARWHRWGRALRWSAAASFVITVPVAGWAVVATLPVVVGGLVVQPTYAGAVLAALGSAAAVVGSLAGLRAEDLGARPGSRRWYVRWPVNALKAVAVVVAWCAAGITLWCGTFSSDLRVLDPPSAGGCRVAVLQDLGGGTIAVLPPGATRPEAVGSYASDDGYEPISRGTYALTWDGETAELGLRGTEHDRVQQDGAERIDCSVF
jgi:hypothetical protein